MEGLRPQAAPPGEHRVQAGRVRARLAHTLYLAGKHEARPRASALLCSAAVAGQRRASPASGHMHDRRVAGELLRTHDRRVAAARGSVSLVKLRHPRSGPAAAHGSAGHGRAPPRPRARRCGRPRQALPAMVGPRLRPQLRRLRSRLATVGTARVTTPRPQCAP